MTYTFSGHERLTLGFETPNQAGAALAMAASALCAACWCELRREKPSRLRFGSFFVLLAIAATALGFTYSRGAFAGLAVSLAVMARLTAASRRAQLAVLLPLLALPLLVPALGTRLQGLAAAPADASITNRLHLWRGAAAIAWDRFPGGASPSGFRELFMAWYQDADRFQVYTTGVSDYITIWAYFGTITLSAYVTVIGFALGASAMKLRGGSDAIGAALLAAGIVYLVASGFSTLLSSTPLFTAFLAIVAVLAGRSLGRGSVADRIRHAFPRLAGVGATVCAFGIAMSYTCAASFPLRPAPVSTVDGAIVQSVEPRRAAPKGLVVVVLDCWAPELDARRLWRPLAEEGFACRLILPADFGARGLGQTRQLLTEAIQQPRGAAPIFLFGIGEGGRLAILASVDHRTGVSGVAAMSAPLWHPHAALSPTAQVDVLHSPVLLLQDQGNRTRNPGELAAFAKAAAASAKSCRVVPVNAGARTPSEVWDSIKSPLLSFFHHRL